MGEIDNYNLYFIICDTLSCPNIINIMRYSYQNDGKPILWEVSINRTQIVKSDPGDTEVAALGVVAKSIN